MDLETGLQLAGAVSLCVAGALFLGTVWTPAAVPVPPEDLGPAGLLATGYGMVFVGVAAKSGSEERRSHHTTVFGAAALAVVAEGGARWQVLVCTGALFVAAAVIVYDALGR